jgi:hypothetical protein
MFVGRQKDVCRKTKSCPEGHSKMCSDLSVYVRDGGWRRQSKSIHESSIVECHPEDLNCHFEEMLAKATDVVKLRSKTSSKSPTYVSSKYLKTKNRNWRGV